MKFAPIVRGILQKTKDRTQNRPYLKEAGEAAGSMELRNTPIEKVIEYIEKSGLKIPKLQENLEIAYDLFNLGKTKRKDMPVIDDKDVRDFQKHLQNGFIDLTDPFSDRTDPSDPFPAGLTDKDATNFMSNGLRDKNKPDDRINVRMIEVECKNIIPLQRQVYVDKSVKSIVKSGIDSTLKFLKSTTLVISQDNRLIDGHHRLLSALILDPNMKVKCMQIDLDIETLLPLAVAYGDAKGNDRNL